jgi:hypothetical protein
MEILENLSIYNIKNAYVGSDIKKDFTMAEIAVDFI